MNEMVERVARAIEEADVGYQIKLTRLVDDVSTYTLKVDVEGFKQREFSSYAEASEACQEYRMAAKARAAMAAMREPTEAMMREGFRNNRHRNTTSCEKPHCVGAITLPPDSAWRAMIDEALS